MFVSCTYIPAHHGQQAISGNWHCQYFRGWITVLLKLLKAFRCLIKFDRIKSYKIKFSRCDKICKYPDKDWMKYFLDSWRLLMGSTLILPWMPRAGSCTHECILFVVFLFILRFALHLFIFLDPWPMKEGAATPPCSPPLLYYWRTQVSCLYSTSKTSRYTAYEKVSAILEEQLLGRISFFISNRFEEERKQKTHAKGNETKSNDMQI